jgi:nitrate reductase delta subunit
MKMTLRAQAALLAYPSAELKENIGAIRSALFDEAALTAVALKKLQPLLARTEQWELLELQADYSELFDRPRHLSLHLFEHVHGESRERGQALIDLGQQYLDRGFYLTTAELPDYLPLFLEFVSCLPAAEARQWLGEPAHVLCALEERLAAVGSPYAAVLHAALQLPEARPDPEAVAALRAQAQELAGTSLDELWEEQPVTFTAPQPAANGGLMARMRAVQEQVVTILKG